MTSEQRHRLGDIDKKIEALDARIGASLASDVVDIVGLRTMKAERESLLCTMRAIVVAAIAS